MATGAASPSVMLSTGPSATAAYSGSCSSTSPIGTGCPMAKIAYRTGQARMRTKIVQRISVKIVLDPGQRDLDRLRGGMSVTDTCFAVGCTSLGSFSSRFTEIVGETPTQYRARDHSDLEDLPSCVSMIATRPRRSPAGV